LVRDRVRIILLADRGWSHHVSSYAVGHGERVVRDSHPTAGAGVAQDVDWQVDRLPGQEGDASGVAGVQLRAKDLVGLHVVNGWKKGLPEYRDGPWFVVSDCSKGDAIRLTELYGKQMGVE
jgi:hypothetical protein